MKYLLSNILCYGLFVLLITSCGGSKKATSTSKLKTKNHGVIFVETNQLDRVLNEAIKKDKLVFVDMYTTWCAPCKVMDEYVFPDPETAKFMNANFINYKVDAEKGNGATLSTIYEATTFPTLLILNQQGSVLEKRYGSTTITELRMMAEAALASR